MKKLVKALENGAYVGRIVSVKTSAEVLGVRKSFDLMNADERQAFEDTFNSPDFYSVTIELNEGRTITTNKFCNKIIWTDKNGDGWTALDFFTNGIARQLELYDAETDMDVFESAFGRDIEFYITQYVNPKTGARSYNVDSSKPKTAKEADDLGLAFE